MGRRDEGSRSDWLARTRPRRAAAGRRARVGERAFAAYRYYGTCSVPAAMQNTRIHTCRIQIPVHVFSMGRELSLGMWSLRITLGDVGSPASLSRCL